MENFRAHQETLKVSTPGAGMTNITAEVARVVGRSGVFTGVCTVFIQHTSASLLIQENADPSVQVDLQAFLDGLAPQGTHYQHDAEGPDDMPAHLKAAVTHTSEILPVTQGRLNVGTWQGLYVLEHRSRPHARTLVVHVQGSASP
jgi:secondary thiamine-phosphate synthase enzyme